jgi:benzoyl-CoA reductase subunit B
LIKQRWETRPLEIWDRAKELRAKWQKSIDNRQHLLAQGNTVESDWSPGFEKYLKIVEDNPVGAFMASKSHSFARRARLASEVRGWGRELCGYVNNCWGAQFLGRDMDGGPFPYRDMCVPFPDVCDQHLKRGQQCMDLSPIPRWGGDMPIYPGERDPKRDEEMIEHRVYCNLKIIADIERIFGIEFDDERFVENIKLREKLSAYGLRISQLMTQVPTPLSAKDLYSFYTLGDLTKLNPEEINDFWKSFVDEVQWRADNRIAAVGGERYRYMEAHPPAWYYLKYYRYLESYGAVCIGSQYSHIMSGTLEVKEDGSLAHRDVTPPADKPIRTREDAVRQWITEARGNRFKDDEYCRKWAITDFARGFKADGAIMALWRCGVGCTLTRKEQALRLSEMGLRVLHCEGSQPGDRTDMDEHGFLDRIDAWMESQGLEKLDDR